MNGARVIPWGRIFKFAPLILALLMSLLLGYSIGFLGEFFYFFALAGAAVMVVLTIENRANILFIYIALVPLSNSLWVQENLMGIQGMKPFNLLGAFLLLIIWIRPERKTKAESRQDALFTRYFLVFYLIFLVAVLRAIPYIPTLHLALPATFVSGTMSFLMSNLVRPSLFLAPMLFIVYNVVTKRELDKVILAVVISMLLYSLFIVYLFFANQLWASHILHRQTYLNYLGYHYNFLATHFIVLTPILFQKALTRKWFYIATFVVSAIAVACLKSRTAYAIFIFAVTFMLWFTGRRKIFPIVALVLMMIGPYLIPAWVIERALFGIASGDLSEISADRLNNIWLPLIAERLEDLPGLLFGLGRYSMVLSKVHIRGSIIEAYGAHNAFLEMVMDSGLIVALAFVAFLVYMGHKLYLQARARKDDFFWALICSYICFLISCMTDRVFYPSYSSMFVFTITGILIVYIKLNPVRIEKKKGPQPEYVNPVHDSQEKEEG